jgi:hypothetical protein
MKKEKPTDRRTPAKNLEGLAILLDDVDLHTAQRGQRVRTNMLGYAGERRSEGYQRKLNDLNNLPGTRRVVLTTVEQPEAARRGFVAAWNIIELK